MMHRPTGSTNGSGLLSASPTTIRNASLMMRGSPLGRRPPLPDRNVAEATIEDAYVRFILHCNPGVPPDTDPTALKEAFRIPPRSEGKVFSSFTLYELIGKLMHKDEIKTWGDLALRLGVDPPNQEKNQSSQKIQQYAVRLKRWMKSMHIDAFFDYLYDNAHEYWTQIPSDATPILEIARDGVAPEDDMALRALLPQIRPRRGRRTRDEDEAGKSPSKLPRLESPMADEFSGGRPDTLDVWSAHPGDGRNPSLFSSQSENRIPGLSAAGAPLSAHQWSNNDVGQTQTPLTAYPHSAITPSTRGNFWSDEPKSAITPSSANKTKAGHKRHGPKVVSSAWRSGPGGTGKTRGRPPINRSPNDGPFSAFPADAPSSAYGSNTSQPASVAPAVASDELTPGHVHRGPHVSPPLQQPLPPPQQITTAPLTSSPLTLQAPQLPANPRPTKPGRLSLQVPKTSSREVRLATPPPVVMVNGEAAPPINGDMLGPPSAPLPLPPAPPPADATFMDAAGVPVSSHLNGGGSNGNSGGLPPQDPFQPHGTEPPRVRFRDPTDRTNMDGLEGFFAHEILTANWFDKNGKEIPRCGVDEAYAIVQTVIENLQRAATTKEGFLINVSALAGGKLLMTTTSLKITLVEECEDHTKYICDWQLQLGDLKGTYSMNELVSHNKWKKRPSADDAAASLAHSAANVASGNTGVSGAGAGFSSFIPGAATATTPATVASTPATTATSGGSSGGAGTAAAARAATVDSVTENGDIGQYGSESDRDVDFWKARYRELADMYRRKDLEFARMQSAVMHALRDPRLDRDKA